MQKPDADYYSRRAEQELMLAPAATNPAAVAAHYRLAHYLERASDHDIVLTAPVAVRRAAG